MWVKSEGLPKLIRQHWIKALIRNVEDSLGIGWFSSKRGKTRIKIISTNRSRKELSGLDIAFKNWDQ